MTIKSSFLVNASKLEEGAKIGKGCWADDESIVYAEGTIIVIEIFTRC